METVPAHWVSNRVVSYATAAAELQVAAYYSSKTEGVVYRVEVAFNDVLVCLSQWHKQPKTFNEFRSRPVESVVNESTGLLAAASSFSSRPLLPAQ
jgi:hypothetical protein